MVCVSDVAGRRVQAFRQTKYKSRSGGGQKKGEKKSRSPCLRRYGPLRPEQSEPTQTPRHSAKFPKTDGFRTAEFRCWAAPGTHDGSPAPGCSPRFRPGFILARLPLRKERRLTQASLIDPTLKTLDGLLTHRAGAMFRRVSGLRCKVCRRQEKQRQNAKLECGFAILTFSLCVSRQRTLIWLASSAATPLGKGGSGGLNVKPSPLCRSGPTASASGKGSARRVPARRREAAKAGRCARRLSLR